MKSDETNRTRMPRHYYSVSSWVWILQTAILMVSAVKANFEFTRNIYNVSIAENSFGKTYATPEQQMGIRVHNRDCQVHFKIISGDRNKFFKTEQTLVGDFWFLLIRTRTSNSGVLNRERKDKYVLTVKATGNFCNGTTGSDGNKTKGNEVESVSTVIVNVLDTNDLNPLFYPTEYVETVPEDLRLHSSVTRVFAEDADLGRNGEIYYSFQERNEQFAIHPTKGIITLTRPLKYAEKSVHELTVLAKDRGPTIKGKLKPSTANVKIFVKQVNLHSPEIYVHHLSDIVENTNVAVYAIVRVVDKDLGCNGEIDHLDIVDGDPDGNFRISNGREVSGGKGREYDIGILKLLDRETAPTGYNLTLQAVDKGFPPRRSYISVPVHLVDLNDNAPVFDREIYEVDVPETSPINFPIIRLKVTDDDRGTNAQVFLEIVGGNEGGEFNINPYTGMMYTAVNLDAEQKSLYTLTVTAIDQGNAATRKQSSAKVKIQVTDTNDNDPLFESSYLEVNIDENESAGLSVIKVVAKDKDMGENGYISYSISNLSPVPFEIDHFTGLVRTTKLLDYESMKRDYVLHVRASDWGVPYRRQTEMKLKIKVLDKNDNKPMFERTNCIGYLPRFVPIGTQITQLSAVDFDSGTIVSYYIESGNEDSCFHLDGTTGLLTVNCDLTKVKGNERIINITSTDGTHTSDVNTVHIKLINTNRPKDFLVNGESGRFECKDTGVARKLKEMLSLAQKHNFQRHNSKEEFAMLPSRYGDNIHKPEFINFPEKLVINETTPLHSTITKIVAKDRDLGYNGELIYGVSSGDVDSVFLLEPDTGILKLIGYLDREERNEYHLNITIHDMGRPQKSVSRILHVTVLDVNDNAPKFKKSLASLKIMENIPFNTSIFKVSATDIDLGENANIAYALITDTDNFRIDKKSGVVYVAKPVDREVESLYELRIKAYDRASSSDDPESLHSEALVRVVITDVNDNAPKFPLSKYTVKVREDIPIGSVVAIVDAKDPDLGYGGEILYSLFDEIDGDPTFTIDNFTGTVRTVKSLDFEEQQMYNLTILATDCGEPSLSSQTTLIVDVFDVNENLYPPLFQDFVVSTSVRENQPIGTAVITVNATDADVSPDDSRVGYYIRAGDGLGYFSIDEQGKKNVGFSN